MKIPGKLEVQKSDGSATTITVNGDDGSISSDGSSAIQSIFTRSITVGGDGSTFDYHQISLKPKA